MAHQGPLGGLSARQRQLLELVARGFTNQAIADEMALSGKTVENYLTNLYAELGIDWGDRSTNPRVKAAVIYIRGSQQDLSALWRTRYRPVGATLSDIELEDVVGGVTVEDQLLRLVRRASQ